MTQAFSETLVTPFDASRAEWARGALGLASGASQEDIRVAVFQAVSGNAFAVPSHVADSVDAVLGRPSCAAPHTLSSTALLEQKVLGEIERFAKSFFAISPHKRRLRWSALNQAADPFPNCRHRMAQLEAGLDLPSQVPAESSGPLGVIRFVRELFVAAPARKPALRRQFLRTVHPADAPLVASAARELVRTHPQTARLEPAFLEHLRRLTPGSRSLRRVEPDDLLWLPSSSHTAAHRARLREKPLPPFVVAIAVPLLALIRFLMSRPQTISRAEFDARGGYRSNPIPLIFIGLLVASLVVHLVFSDESPLRPWLHARPAPQVRANAATGPHRSDDVLGPLSREDELLPGERCRVAARLLNRHLAEDPSNRGSLVRRLNPEERAAAVRMLAFYREMSDSHQQALQHGIAVAELPPAPASSGEFVIPLLYPGERAELERAIRALQAEEGR